MQKIIHLSDLHFGTERIGIVPLLIEKINHLDPDIIVVSGDLTQRARHQQFKEVQQFLQEIKKKRHLLCVPGNHDISLYNWIERFFYPFSKYKNWIAPEICAHLSVDNIVILGINSVTPFKPMSGFVSEKQRQLIKDFFATIPEDKVKIVVMHHNLIASERHKIINDADNLIKLLSEVKVNLVLSGHIHFACIEPLKKINDNHIYVITAGTAISTRTIAPNSFNFIEINHHEFSMQIVEYVDEIFVAQDKFSFPI